MLFSQNLSVLPAQCQVPVQYLNYIATCIVLCTFPDINECSSNPCQNGAQCVDRVNGYTCTCASGWTGTLCNVGMCTAFSKALFVVSLAKLLFFIYLYKYSESRTQDRINVRIYINCRTTRLKLNKWIFPNFSNNNQYVYISLQQHYQYNYIHFKQNTPTSYNDDIAFICLCPAVYRIIFHVYN